jgi:tetratricopeptide (TPR) repeat protein
MDETPEDFADQGRSAYRSGDFLKAASLFLKASETCAEAGNQLLAAEMANNQSVALLQSGDAAAALAASQGTDLIFAQAGDPLREGLALGNQAAALKELGRKKESLELFRQSIPRFEKAGDKENLAVVHKTIAALEMESGDNLGAMSAMLDSMRLTEKLTWRQKIMRWLFSLVSRMMPK